MRIVVLIENLAYRRGLLAEHGVSFLIQDDDGQSVLFDTGQSDGFIHNAKILGIDLKKVGHLVISHGHYDHAGGLSAFLRLNRKALVYAHPMAFVPRYHADRPHQRKSVGLSRMVLPMNRLRHADGVRQITKSVYLVSGIAIQNRWDTHFDGFYSGRAKDQFLDEQFVVIKKQEKISILSGCSHCGITNIVATAERLFDCPLGVVLGGTHLVNSNAKKVGRVADYFRKRPGVKLGLCHCTGVDAYAEIKKQLPKRAFYSHTGVVVDL